MNTNEKIKIEIGQLVQSANELKEKMNKDMDISDFRIKYQKWYSSALKIIEAFGLDRLKEFEEYYNKDSGSKDIHLLNYTIQHFLMAIGPSSRNWDPFNAAKIRFENQISILKSLEDRIDSILIDVTGYLQADIQSNEIDVAEKLIKVSLRAAGAVAGVVLESHLHRIAINHNIKNSKKNSTISDLNDLLKNAEVLDTPTWRKIQYLADIRNYCDHKKDREPTEDEVKEIVAGVKNIIMNIF